MILKEYNKIPVFHFDNLSNHKDIFHFVTTRKGGYSLPPFESFNFGYAVGDNKTHIEKNKELLAEIVGVDKEHFFFPKQMHSNKILEVKSVEDRHTINEGVDGLITNKSGFAICVKGADCVPLLFLDREKRVIGVAHAGWKGTFCRIGQKMVERMKETYQSRPENIIIGIGPSISQYNYEISRELAEKFTGEFDQTVVKVKDHNYFLDLWLTNKKQLINAGVPEENIEISGLCTYGNPELFYSHRFSKGVTGRFIAGICLVKK